MTRCDPKQYADLNIVASGGYTRNAYNFFDHPAFRTGHIAYATEVKHIRDGTKNATRNRNVGIRLFNVDSMVTTDLRENT